MLSVKKTIFFIIFFSVLINSGFSKDKNENNEPQKTQKTIEKNSVQKDQVNSQKNTNVDNNTSFYQDPTKQPIKNVSYSYFFFKALIILIVFAVAGYFVSRFFKKRSKMFHVVGGPIEILYSFPMGIGRSLDVLKVVNEVLLVSNTQDKVEFLYKIEEKEAIDMFKLERDKTSVSSQSFFSDIFSRYSKLKTGEALDVTKKLKERIGRIKK